MKADKKLKKGGDFNADRIDKALLRRARAYRRPTKDALMNAVLEELDDHADESTSFVGVGRSDFITLFVLVGSPRPMLRYHTEIAELDADERRAKMAEIRAEYERQHCHGDARVMSW